ncbi:DNA polymerase III subunit chi [Paracoccaceae bacterium]|nr:DNA polymerase III subunit chi [Paracoccaceae bacterium]
MALGKLEKAFFYNSSHRDVVTDIAWLTQNIFTKNNRIVIFCTDQDTVEVVDDFLWSYRDDGFIPHSIKKHGETSLDPILVTTDLDGGYEHNILLALNGVLIEEKDWQRFAKIYYFFDDQDNKEKENARSMWKSFSSLDVDCKYWINKKNKWVLANSR